MTILIEKEDLYTPLPVTKEQICQIIADNNSSNVGISAYLIPISKDYFFSKDTKFFTASV